MKSDNCPLFKKHGTHGMVVAIDLDDTLFKGDNFPDVGDPLPNVLSRLRLLNDSQREIIIHTSRINSVHYGEHIDEQIAKIRQAFVKHNLPAYEIWVGRGKPLACHYVDDKAWNSVNALIEELQYRDTVR